MESKNSKEKDFDIFSLRARAVPRESFSPENTNGNDQSNQWVLRKKNFKIENSDSDFS